MSTSGLSNGSILSRGCSSCVIFLCALLPVIVPGLTAGAEDGRSKQHDDSSLQSLKTMLTSEKRLTLARTVAETTGVEMLRRFVGKDELYAKRLGFESLSQVTDGKPVALPPFPVFRVGLAQLQRYDGHPLPLLLHKGVAQFVVPMTVEKQAQALSAITVRLGGDGKSDKILQWGSRNFIRRLSTLRSELAQKKQSPELAFFIVEVPALNRVYLGYLQKPETAFLMPISGAPAGLDREPLPIDIVFKTLATEAQVAGDALR